MKVMVIGGGGFYGRYLVADLIEFSEAKILVVSRNPPADLANHPRIQTVACDLHDRDRLCQLMRSCGLVIHCAGPFQYLPLTPLLVAIETRTDYLDLAEDRRFNQEVQALQPEIEAAGITVLTGLSVSPGFEMLFAEMGKHYFAELTGIRTYAAPDTRKHRGPAMFATMLMGVGQPFWQPEGGEPRLVHGWTEPEWVEFPPPIGRRLTHLVLEMAHLDLLPDEMGVGTVAFKAGTEWTVLNRLLNLSARIRRRWGWPRWERLTALVRALSWLMGRFGKDEGGVIFALTGRSQGRELTHRLAINARRDGGLIPAILASIAASRLISGDLQASGLVPLNNWLTTAELLDELRGRGLEIWWQPDGAAAWERLPAGLPANPAEGLANPTGWPTRRVGGPVRSAGVR